MAEMAIATDFKYWQQLRHVIREVVSDVHANDLLDYEDIMHIYNVGEEATVRRKIKASGVKTNTEGARMRITRAQAEAIFRKGKKRKN